MSVNQRSPSPVSIDSSDLSIRPSTSSNSPRAPSRPAQPQTTNSRQGNRPRLNSGSSSPVVPLPPNSTSIASTGIKSQVQLENKVLMKLANILPTDTSSTSIPYTSPTNTSSGGGGGGTESFSSGITIDPSIGRLPESRTNLLNLHDLLDEIMAEIRIISSEAITEGYNKYAFLSNTGETASTPAASFALPQVDKETGKVFYDTIIADLTSQAMKKTKRIKNFLRSFTKQILRQSDEELERKDLIIKELQAQLYQNDLQLLGNDEHNKNVLMNYESQEYFKHNSISTTTTAPNTTSANSNSRNITTSSSTRGSSSSTTTNNNNTTNNNECNCTCIVCVDCPHNEINIKQRLMKRLYPTKRTNPLENIANSFEKLSPNKPKTAVSTNNSSASFASSATTLSTNSLPSTENSTSQNNFSTSSNEFNNNPSKPTVVPPKQIANKLSSPSSSPTSKLKSPLSSPTKKKKSLLLDVQDETSGLVFDPYKLLGNLPIPHDEIYELLSKQLDRERELSTEKIKDLIKDLNESQAQLIQAHEEINKVIL